MILMLIWNVLHLIISFIIYFHTLYLIASTKHIIIGAVLNNAFTVPVGRYFSGAKNIDTVRALQNILFSMVMKTK